MLANQISEHRYEAGCDEAGRGCLAGPVVAAAVILPQNYSNEILNDSKQLSKLSRNKLRKIIERDAVAFGVQFISHKTIDEKNILQSSLLAMHGALNQLGRKPQFIAVDGNRFIPYKKIPFQCVVKGDGKLMNIAAASILAKTYRDEHMEKLHIEFPAYQWDTNKGYPTKKHREAIASHGPSPYHRLSFNLLPSQLRLQL